MVQGTDTKRFPVESVPWPAVWEFCRRLSKLPEEENAGREYRLPTEAEWEYACRGGSTSTETLPFHVGAMLFPHQANCWDSELRRTTTVGSYRPNAFGLYDMHGNVREWCSDWHGPYPTDSKLQQDPQGPLHGSRRILRGGSWLDGAAYCRAAVRHEANPKAVDFDKAQGFRVVCILPSQIP
jgi:formylglycine-generating enzyme required for sulfatase activity